MQTEAKVRRRKELGMLEGNERLLVYKARGEHAGLYLISSTAQSSVF